MDHCLSEQDLAEYVRGAAPQERIRAWERHLETCADCETKVLALRDSRSGGADAHLSRMATGSFHASDPRSETAVELPPGDAIEGYKILRELHRGGQGAVYQAIQRATKRKVALKMILGGPFAAAESKRRFEREVELLGSLHHPNIVPIFDSGVSHGRFYYAMEYIRGERLTDYARNRKMGTEETLRLFKKVCEAVDYAHQRGVIHRDLKPSNILVGDSAEPHILDFGLAKVAGAEAGAEAASLMVSVTGQVMGTPAYMSPEQAAGRPDQVDMRSDVYALGVILYELLTGQHPFDLKLPVPDLLTSIQHGEPRRPGTVRRGIGDEVETIVLKALAKEKTRRYITAGALGQDIERYLAGDPIEAKRDSALYLLKKSLRRYKLPVAIALGFFAVIMTSLCMAVALWRFAASERDRATVAEQLARARLEEVAAAKRDSDRARDLAELEKRRAESEKGRADAQAHEAEQSRTVAVAEKNRADVAAEELRGKVYLYYMSLAQKAFEASHITRLKQLLAEASPNYRGWEWDRLNWRSDLSTATFHGHDGMVLSVAFSPDGSRVASCGVDRTVRIWDAKTGQVLHTWRGPAADILSVDFSPDGTRLVVGAFEANLRVWDAESGAELMTLRGTAAHAHALFSSDGRLIAASGNGIVDIWDASTGDLLRTLHGHTGFLRSIALSPDSTRIASAGAQDQTLKVWDIATGETVATLRESTPDFAAIAFSPDGSRLISGSYDGMVRVRDGATGKELRAWKAHDGPPFGLTYTGDGQRIVTGSWDRTIKTWDLAGVELGMLRGHGGGILSIALSLDEQRLASASEDGTIKIWDSSTLGDTFMLTGPGAILENQFANMGVAFSRDGKKIASAAREELVKLWDVASGEELRFLQGHEQPVYSVDFSADGQQLVSAAGDRTIRLWDARSGDELKVLRGHGVDIAQVRFDPQGKRIAGAGGDRSVRLWNVAIGKELPPLHGHELAVTTVAFSPDGTRIASGSKDKTVRIWNADSGQLLQTLRGHAQDVSSVSFSRDGDRVVSGSMDHSIKIWDTASGKELHHLGGHGGFVTCVAFSPDGRRIASCSVDFTVKIWDASSGEELLTLRDLKLPVMALAFSPRGDTIAAIDHVGSVTLWETGPPAAGVEARKTALAARKIVNELFAERIFARDVVQVLEADDALSEPVRAAAIRLATARGDPALALNNQSWSVVKNRSADADYALALRKAQTACQVFPDDGRLRTTLGLAQYRAGQPEAALATLAVSDEADLRGPLAEARPAAVATRALAQIELGRWDRALVAFDRLRVLLRHQKFMNTPDFRLLVGELRDTVARFIEKQPDDARVRVALGSTLWMAGRTDDALEEFKKSVELDPACGLAYSQLGCLLSELSQHQEAVSALRRAFELNESASDSAHSSADRPVACFVQSLRATGQSAEAERLLRGMLTKGEVAEPDAVWDLWLAVSVGDLRQAPAELLNKLPTVLPGTPRRHEASRAETRRFLEALANDKTVRINCGGGEYRSSHGQLWSRDRFASGGYRHGETSPNALAPPDSIAGTEDIPLYQTNRWFTPDPRGRSFRPNYTIPLPDGRYRVTLHWAEIYGGIRAAGMRVFDILLEGELVLAQYDSLAAGFATAHDKSFETVVSDGFLNIEFVHRVENPMVAAIEIQAIE